MEVILIIAVAVMFIYGYYIVAGIDKMLSENRKIIENDEYKNGPSAIMLTGNMSDEDIMNEIRMFRQEYAQTCIVLYAMPDINNTYEK